MNVKNNGTKITKMSQRVLKILIAKKEPMKPRDLVDDLDLNLRSVRYALKLLAKMELVERKPDLTDLRTNYYYIPDNNLKQANNLSLS
ncbi:MAG: winged helix DNA-binding protein [Candidatus Hodarchaeales archaeon]|jgi:DNA-binding MarR family transcriptional regulator